MARIRVTLDGREAVNGSPLLMHNERLADPLDPYSKWVAEISKKTKKTEREIEELSRREFQGAGYWDVNEGPDGKDNGVPVIPVWNIIRCIQEAAKSHKFGKQVIRALVPITDTVELSYDGPRLVDELWKAQTFHSRKGVGVGQRKVMRTRPCFSDWRIDVELELDLTQLDPGQVNLFTYEAGKYIGLGDARPRFGRFLGTAELLEIPAEFVVPDVLDDVRSELARQAQQQSIQKDDVAHRENNPDGKARRKSVKRVLDK